MEEYITRPEFEQYSQRMDDEDKRQNHRLQEVEDRAEQITTLTLNVSRLTDSMERMANELQEMGEGLKAIEEKPVKNWNTVKVAVLTAIGTAIGTGLVAWFISIV